MAPDENPFLISTPPPAPDAEPPTSESPADEPAVDTDRFITLPPDILDSGTLRVSAPRVERVPVVATEPGEIVFFPVVPGIPVARPIDPHVPETGSAEARSSVVPIAEPPTQNSASATTWRIILPRSGKVVPMHGALYIGRNPARTADRQDAELLAVDDPARSLSKTHALLEVVDDVLWVHDLDSTNGVTIVESGGAVLDVEPGQRAAVPSAAELELGDYVVRVEKH